MRDRAALALSLRYGQGDLHWFARQSREDQARLLAYGLVQQEETERARRGRRQREDPHYDALLAQARASEPQDASEYLRRKAERLAQGRR